MRRWERWAMHLGAVSATLTGVAYGAVRYFGQRVGEFGPEPHPWQGTLQHLHVLAVPVLAVGLGIAARGHAVGMLQHHVTRGRWSGMGLLSLAAPMVFAGYAVQVCTEATPRTVAAWVHGVASVLFAVAWGMHWAKRRIRSGRRARHA